MSRFDCVRTTSSPGPFQGYQMSVPLPLPPSPSQNRRKYNRRRSDSVVRFIHSHKVTPRKLPTYTYVSWSRSGRGIPCVTAPLTGSGAARSRNGKRGWRSPKV